MRAGGEAGIGEGGDRPGAGEGVGGERDEENRVGIFERHKSPGRRDLGGGVLRQHAADQRIAQGGGQHAGRSHVIVLDRRLVLGRMFGDVLGNILEHDIDRRPAGRIAGVGLLAGPAFCHRRLGLTVEAPMSYIFNSPLRDLAMKRFVWFVLGVMMMSLPVPAGALSIDVSERVFFASGSAELDDATKRVLDQVFKFMAVISPAHEGLTIQGHTDHKEVPGGRESLALGEKRAQAVKDYLVSKGIAAKRIAIISYGWFRPTDPTSDDSPKNRRAVMIEWQVQLLAPAWVASIDPLREFEEVFFASGSAEFDDTAKRVLDRQFRVVDSFHTDLGLTISGHAEEKEVPGRREAVALGERRAQAVKDYLVSKGLAPEQIDTLSYGWYESNRSTRGDGSKNRRTVTRGRRLQ